jgi:hypothetical protein
MCIRDSLVRGPHYKKRNDALVGGIEFTILALLLIVNPIAASLPPDKLMQPLLDWVASYYSILLTVMVALAVFDAGSIRIVSPPEDVKKKK